MIPTIAPPFPHTAVLERDRAAGAAPSGNRLPPDYGVHNAALPCAFWEPEKLPLGLGAGGLQRGGQGLDPVALGPRILVPRGTDAGVGDRIRDVADGLGIFAAGPFKVVDDVWRRTHRELALEQAGALVAPEAS